MMPTSIVGTRVMKTMQERFSRGDVHYLRPGVPDICFAAFRSPNSKLPRGNETKGIRTV